MLDRHLDRFDAAVDAELVEDIRDVEFDGTETHHEPIGDLVVVEALDHALEHVPFAVGELLAGDLGLRHRLCQHLGGLRGKRHAPRAGRTDGGAQLLGSDVLLQVADGARLQCTLHHVLLGKTGQCDHFHLRVFFVDLARGCNAVGAGHHQIHQHDIRLVQRDHLDGFCPVGGFAHQLEILVDHEKFR